MDLLYLTSKIDKIVFAPKNGSHITFYQNQSVGISFQIFSSRQAFCKALHTKEAYVIYVRYFYTSKSLPLNMNLLLQTVSTHLFSALVETKLRNLSRGRSINSKDTNQNPDIIIDIEKTSTNGEFAWIWSCKHVAERQNEIVLAQRHFRVISSNLLEKLNENLILPELKQKCHVTYVFACKHNFISFRRQEL